MKLTSRERLLIFITSILLCASLYYNLFYKNIRYEIKQMDQDIIKADLDASNMLQKDDQIKELRNIISKIKTEAQGLQISLDEELIEPSIVVFIEESIQGLGIGTKTILVEVEEYEDFKIMTFNFGFETSYNNLKEIFSNIVNSPWSNSIRDIKAYKNQPDSVNPLYDWDVGVLIEFYLLPIEDNS